MYLQKKKKVFFECVLLSEITSHRIRRVQKPTSYDKKKM